MLHSVSRRLCVMMRDYVRISLETHLFFARIMKEHAFFLEAGFMPKDTGWRRKAAFFRNQFEDLLRQTVKISDRMISGSVLDSEELVTPFTLDAEKGTSSLSGIPIDSRITRMEQALDCGRMRDADREMIRRIQRINDRALELLDGLIEFKENILREVGEGQLFTVNYPLLVEHIMREAKLYRDMVREITSGREVNFRKLQNTEAFWNQIMMEHAQFIRGLLDPTEEELIKTADQFAMDFEELLKSAKRQDCRASQGTRERSLETTRRLQEFKTAGTKGILNGEITSIILPLLADHVLREANHYIRILECGFAWKDRR